MVTACATGTHAIGESARIIGEGIADAMLAGGTALITRWRWEGLRHEGPLHAERRPGEGQPPFDAERDGFVAGEGAAASCLEERGARAPGERASTRS